MVTIEENHELLDIILGYKPDNYVPTYIEAVFVNNTGTHIDFTLTSPNGDVFTEIKTYYLSDEGDWVWSASAEGYITKTDTITVRKIDYGNIISISITLEPESGEVRITGQGYTDTFVSTPTGADVVYSPISRADIEHSKFNGNSYLKHSDRVLQYGSYLYYDNFQSSYKNTYILEGYKTLNYYYKTNNVSEINLDTIYLVDSTISGGGWFRFNLIDELTGNPPTGRFYCRLFDDWGRQDDEFAELEKIPDETWEEVENNPHVTAEMDHTGYYTAMIWGDYYKETFVNIWYPNRGEEKTVYVTPTYSADGLRAILTWGASPSDLDSHLKIYNGSGTQVAHVYYGDTTYSEDGVEMAGLDVDDTSSYGPETTTIYQLKAGYMYYFYIYNFSDGTLIPTNAKVEIKDGNRLIATVIPPGETSDSTTGGYWKVFSYSANTKEIRIKNKQVGYEPTQSNWESD